MEILLLAEEIRVGKIGNINTKVDSHAASKSLNSSNTLLSNMILIDREKETGWLKEAYSRRNAELGVIYGRRRLGKTFLIKTFVADKPHFYFLAKQQDMGLELGRFKDKIGKKFNVFLEAKRLGRAF